MRYTKKKKNTIQRNRSKFRLKGGAYIDFEQIEKLADLKNKNLITEEEYNQSKKNILDMSNNDNNSKKSGKFKFFKDMSGGIFVLELIKL